TDRPAEKADTLLDFYFELRDFVSTFDVMADDYVIYSYMDGEKHFHLKLFCMSPARRLQEIVDKGRAAVFFSASFLPAAYYKELLSRREDIYAAYAESPFDDERKIILIGRDVSTRYRSRGDTMYRRIAFYIHETVMAKRGNYMAFFPSYRFMQDVLRIYQAEYDEDEVDYVAQSRYMGEMDREIFLENFYEDPGRTLVGFCVMGGVFAEGIDLTGSKLIGAVIVGCGLPQVSAETELIREYYDGRTGTASQKKGYAYAYLIPGMNKVLQSAGRVIRTAADRGVILLLDDRFLTGECRRLFPREWKSYIPCRAEQVREILAGFWES
ncbi:MAG: helicase C-terminal domain-containing protein, partial [Lachnospiraceae bacterium]|nr:helicase C-terminal domain-containing protein [Lachnospiraceae bacterium]